MSDHAAVLFANDAFYVAFAAADMTAMEAAWAGSDSITCIHPGWHALYGRDAVMDSWRSILGAASAPKIRVQGARAQVMGDVAYVVCHEILGRGQLIATNVFVREAGRWRMVHHQAGQAPPPEEGEEAPESLQ